MASKESIEAAEARLEERDLPLRSEGVNPGDQEAKIQTEQKSSQSKKSKNKGKSATPAEDQSNGTKSKSSSDPGKIGISELPDFVKNRNEIFDRLKRKYDAEILQKDHPIIDVVLDLGLDKDGAQRPAMPVAAKAWESTPGSFLKHVDKEISADVVIAKVDGKELWDLDRPIERNCRISYLPFTSPEGRNVFWHSSAHVLGEAAECHYGCLLSHGPPVEQGFFYDMAIAEG